MHALIVEDDTALGAFLEKGLTREGDRIKLLTDGETAVSYTLEHRPDLMVLDLSLPRKDGIEVLKELSGRVPATSILVLTGRREIQDRITCLNLGADDCLLKPFSLFELTARCRALMRRREQFADPVLRHGAIELNRIDRKVTRDGRPVDLTGKEFALLEYLLQASGRCCSRSELLREVWHMSPDAGTNVVDVYVNYLRKKLGAAFVGSAGEGVQLIETVRGSGYMLGLGTMRRPVRSGVLEEAAFGLGSAAGHGSVGRA